MDGFNEGVQKELKKKLFKILQWIRLRVAYLHEFFGSFVQVTIHSAGKNSSFHCLTQKFILIAPSLQYLFLVNIIYEVYLLQCEIVLFLLLLTLKCQSLFLAFVLKKIELQRNFSTKKQSLYTILQNILTSYKKNVKISFIIFTVSGVTALQSDHSVMSGIPNNGTQQPHVFIYYT